MSNEYESSIDDLLGGLDLPSTADRDAGNELLGAIVINWRELPATEAPDAWNALRDWVEWIIHRYNVPDVTIPDCWWQHGALVEELSALHAAWVASFDPTDSGYGPIGWHERWAVAKDRLRKHYSGECKHGHKSPSPRTLPAPDESWSRWVTDRRT